MTKLLERAIAAASRLDDEQQDALAARILDEIQDEQAWDRAFAATTDEQWARLAALARRDREAPGAISLDDLVDRRRG